MSHPNVTIIAAASENNVIGRNGKIPWDIPEDLKRFKLLTSGHSVIMGRKTFESIGRPLPRRRNIVLTHEETFTAPGVEVFHSLEEALATCAQAERIFIIGGGHIYNAALPLTDTIELTRVHKVVEGDVFFPVLAKDEWRLVAEKPHKGYSFLTYERV